MKNPQFEQCRRSARTYHRNKRGDQFELGILVQHDYRGVDPKGLSWWDDVQFIRGGRRIAVAWIHPRNSYQDLILADAHVATRHLYDRIEGGMFSNESAVYRKVGRSRKKVSSYRTTSRPGEQEWFDALRTEEARLSRETSYSVYPSMRVESLAWCRFVTICAPIEVRNPGELRKLADLVRRLLMGQTTLAKEFPGYVYTRDQWQADGLTDQANRVHSMWIAGT
jgi:hypothetical protein